MAAIFCSILKFKYELSRLNYTGVSLSELVPLSRPSLHDLLPECTRYWNSDNEYGLVIGIPIVSTANRTCYWSSDNELRLSVPITNRTCYRNSDNETLAYSLVN
jgi:hypothetical protein